MCTRYDDLRQRRAGQVEGGRDDVRYMGRRHMKALGIYRRQYKLWVYRVETTSILIPEWAQLLQMPDFDREPQVAWLSSAIAKQVARMDREDGGTPSVMKCEYKRCKICKKLRLQLGAVRSRWDQKCKGGLGNPCGPSCEDDARVLRQLKRNGQS